MVLESGDTKFREESWARKAEIEYLDKDYAAAMESFKHLQAVAENPENKEAAKLGLMRCAELTGQPQEALLAANNLLKEPKLSPEIMSEARYVRAKAYISLKQENKALADLRRSARIPVRYTGRRLNIYWLNCIMIIRMIRMPRLS